MAGEGPGERLKGRRAKGFLPGALNVGGRKPWYVKPPMMLIEMRAAWRWPDPNDPKDDRKPVPNSRQNPPRETEGVRRQRKILKTDPTKFMALMQKMEEKYESRLAASRAAWHANNPGLKPDQRGDAGLVRAGELVERLLAGLAVDGGKAVG